MKRHLESTSSFIPLPLFPSFASFSWRSYDAHLARRPRKWRRLPRSDQLALVQPLLERLDIPPSSTAICPQIPSSNSPMARSSVFSSPPAWPSPSRWTTSPTGPKDTGADLVWGIPAAKLNDDRLGRALDAFFSKRHSILASITAAALEFVDAAGPHPFRSHPPSSSTAPTTAPSRAPAPSWRTSSVTMGCHPRISRHGYQCKRT